MKNIERNANALKVAMEVATDLSANSDKGYAYAVTRIQEAILEFEEKVIEKPIQATTVAHPWEVYDVFDGRQQGYLTISNTVTKEAHTFMVPTVGAGEGFQAANSSLREFVKDYRLKKSLFWTYDSKDLTFSLSNMRFQVLIPSSPKADEFLNHFGFYLNSLR